VIWGGATAAADHRASLGPMTAATPPTQPSAVDLDAFERMVAATMPIDPRFRWRATSLQRGRAELQLDYDAAFVRPGGTISGPTMFTLADLTLWAGVLSVIGMQPLAVTAHLTIHFLRRPPPAALVARCEILRTGRRLVHGDVRIYSAGTDAPVCHATGAYAIPEAPPAVP
jgi:acyl-coenzyme A thioesterase PaaI-like protein